MGSLLVHVTHGPEAPTRAALAFLVAKAAVDAGHEVHVFVAGDGVQLLREATADAVQGIGTGSLRESLDAVVAGGGKVYASGMSSKVRGVTEPVGGAEMAMPGKLVELLFACDRALTY
jgi:predicted peroxiredoxin